MNIINALTGEARYYKNITSFIIYGNGEKLVEIERKSDMITPVLLNAHGEYKEEYCTERVESINLSMFPKSARKENLYRKDAYTLPLGLNWNREREYALYIPVSEIEVIPMGEQIACQTENEVCYKPVFSLTFTHGYVQVIRVIEKVENAGNNFIPSDGRWGDGFGTKDSPFYDVSHFSKNESETVVFRRYKVTEIRHEMLIAPGCYTRIEYSEERKRVQAIADKLNDNNVFSSTVSSYDVEKLLKLYDLIEKEV